jgi:two-component system nitrate/nitrite response regulator NarL
MIPTVIIDKSELFRTGLLHLLAGSRFRIRAGAAKLSDLSENAFTGHCMVLISLDREAPAIVPQVSNLTRQHKSLHVITLTERFCPEELLAAIEAGAVGYFLKNEITPDALVKSLELVLLGGVVIPQGFPNQLKDRVQLEADTVPAAPVPETTLEGGQPQPASDAAQMDDLVRLSSREQMILDLLTQGASNKHIARELNITETTVKVHVKNLLRKIRVNNRTQAAMWAMDRIRPNGQLKQPLGSSPTGGGSDTTSGT